MALFPCAVGLHRYAGHQRSAYLGIANGALSARSKLRLCNQHFQDLQDFCEEALHLVAIGTTSTEDDAFDTQECRNHPDRRADYRCYATLYPLQEEGRVYFATMCEEDAAGFRRVGQIELS